MSIGTPAAEIDIDESMVHQLLLDQHPDLADETLLLIDAGWDNMMYHLGDDLVIRLPRRSEGVPLIEHEQTWLPILADRLPLAVPAPSGAPQNELRGVPLRKRADTVEDRLDRLRDVTPKLLNL